MKYLLPLVTFFASLLISPKLFSQTIPVGTPALEDYYRRMQLLGKVDSNLSFSVRPLFAESIKGNDIFDPEGILKKNWNKPEVGDFAQGKGMFRVLPFTVLQQFNSHHPYGWNDGTMIPAKGYQTQISGGIYFKYGPLSIQLRPDFVYAVNPPFDGFESGHSEADISTYYRTYFSVDYPERFFNQPYQKVSLGASSIRANFGAISIGLSNENLWWGPGISHSLILTNNAPGFKHISISTLRPINTGIGFFEGEIISGLLDNSGMVSPVKTAIVRNERRYFTGYNLNYHPKWISGLTLGMIRSFSSYYKDNKSLGDFIPFFTPFQKRDVNSGVGDTFPRNQVTSLYARWLFTKANAELYFEYGWEDNLYNIRDFIGSPEHTRAYVFGLRKLFPLSGSDYSVMFDTELIQTSHQSAETAIRDDNSWYMNYQLVQGHTNMGQILGSGVGPGGNMQSVNVCLLRGLKRLGIGLERYEHNMDFSTTYYPDINGNSRNWVDLAFSLQGEWDYKNLIFNAKLKTIKSFNYQWILKNYTPDNYYIPNNTVYNLHAQLGVTYRF